MATKTVGTQIGDDYATPSLAIAAEPSPMTLQMRDEVFADGNIGDGVKQITLVAHPGNSADTFWTIDATAKANGLKLNAVSEVNGAEVKNSTADGITSWTGGPQSFSVYDSYVHDVAGKGISQLNESLGVRSFCHRNIVADTGGWGIHHVGDGGRIANCLVIRATGYGIWSTTSGGDPTFLDYCTVYGTVAGGGDPGTGIYEGSNSLYPNNCISVGNDGNGFDLQFAGAAAYSIAFGNGGADYGAGDQGVGSITLDPVFRNAGADDFRLGSTSPARNLASSSHSIADDISGAVRPDATSGDFDTGSYQYASFDCGIVSAEPIDSLSVAVAFTQNPAGPQVPLQASAEDAANWTVASVPVDAALVVVNVTKASDLVYVVEYNHRTAPGATITVDSSLVDTDLGGLCDDPGTGAYTAISDPANADTSFAWPFTYAMTMDGEVLSDSDA